jgi:hypothetical protein
MWPAGEPHLLVGGREGESTVWGFLWVGRGLASSLGQNVSQSPFIFFVVPFYFLFLFSDFLLPFAFWLQIG